MKSLPLALACCLLAAVTSISAAASEPAVSKYTEHSTTLNIEASWQRFGMALPDEASDSLVQDAVKTFRALAQEEYLALEDLRKSDPDFVQHPYEMALTGTISGNGKTAAVLWQVYQYLGGAHGNLAVIAQNYTVPEGRAFDLADLFGKPDTALRLLSEQARRELLGRGLPPDMVNPGTEPEPENFQTFLLTVDGITLYFSPYQVAPWSEGVVTVTLPIDSLADAEPHAEYWK